MSKIGSDGATPDGRPARTGDGDVDDARRVLLRRLSRSAYVAPAAVAMMTMKANASSVTC